MDCDFCLDMDIGGCEFSAYAVTFIEAPRPFKCFECDRHFPGGVMYEFTTAEDCDGKPFRAETCSDCHYIAAALICGSRSHGSLWDGIEQEMDEGARFTTACLAKVETISAKKYLVERINRLNGLSSSNDKLSEAPAPAGGNG